MADLQISALPALGEAGIQATDVLALADLSATETKKVTVKDLVARAAALLDDGDIPAAKVATPFAADAVATATIQNLAVTAGKIANGTITATQIANATITGAKLVNNTVTATQIAANAIGSSELADDAVDTAAIADLAVDNARIANTTIAYGKLNLADGDIPGAKIAAGGITSTQLATNSVTATELADNAVDANAIASGVITGAKIASTTIAAGNIVNNTITATQIADGAIGTDQIANGAVTAAKLSGTIEAGTLADGAVSTLKLADDAVDSSKLAANAVDAAALADNAVDSGAIESNAVIEAKIAANAVTNAKIADGTITAAKFNTSNLDRSLNVASGNLGINNTITAATRSGITFNAQGLITSTVALGASDLPVATSSAVGGVSVGTGLSVNGSGVLSLSNSVTGATVSGITFSNSGQITAATALVASDLPVATTSAKGAVQITSGGGLTVDGSGNLTTSTSGVSAGTYQSVTVNTKGVITAGSALTETQIPSLPASKITSGSLDAARIANDSIGGDKLSNTSTAIFQSIAQSGYPTAQFSGQILFDTVSEDAFIWDGNAWQAITTLTKGSLVFGGTYNAGTSQMVATTSAGIAAGLSVGSNLPSPSSTTDGVYVVVSSSGTPSAPAPAIAFAPPDYILGVTNSAGSSWNEVDLSQTVAGQVASNITFTPYGQISSTNVQDAIQELETEKLALAGGTVTGQVLIGNTGSLVFEGSTVDAYETTLTVADPTTSDKTITLPNVTGTVITSGDTNTVTSTMVDGSLVNANLAATAAIAFTKLEDLTAAKILVGNASDKATAVTVTGDISIDNAGLTAIAAGVIVDADISGSAAITGSKIATGTTSAVGVLQLTDSTSSTSATTAATPNAVKTAYDLANTANTTANAAVEKAGDTMTGNLILDNAKELRLSEADSNGANYLGLKAPDSVTADITWTLPDGDGSANQFLKTDGSGNLSWGTDNATDNTKMPLTGGVFNGDVTFTGANADIVFDKSDDAFELEDNAKIDFGAGTGGVPDLSIYSDGTNGVLKTQDGGTILIKDGSNTMATFSGASNQLDIHVQTVFIGASSNASWDKANNRFSGTITEVNVTANNSTDETCYPLFADGATGSQGAESDTGLTYNPSTGLLTSTGFSGAGTSLTALNASNLSSGTVATARLGTGTASSSNFLRGDNSWQTIDLTNLSATNLTSGTVPDARFPATLPAASGANLTTLNASNLSSGTVNVARLGTGSSVSSKFLRGDNTWQTISATPEGTAILSTGESGGTKFLREDGDGTCSWQSVPAGVTINNQSDNRIITATGTTNTLESEADLTFNGSSLGIGTNGSISTGANFSLSSNALTVTGTATVVGQFNGATIPTVQVSQTTDNTDIQIRANATGGLVRTASNTPLVFGTNQIERFRVGTSGQLGVGGANYGTSGQILTSGGASAAPSWQDAAGSVILIDGGNFDNGSSTVSSTQVFDGGDFGT